MRRLFSSGSGPESSCRNVVFSRDASPITRSTGGGRWPHRFASISRCAFFSSSIAKAALLGNKFIHDSRANRRSRAEGIDTETGADGAPDLMVPVYFCVVYPEASISDGLPPGRNRMGDLLVRMPSAVLCRAIRTGQPARIDIQPAPNLFMPPRLKAAFRSALPRRNA